MTADIGARYNPFDLEFLNNPHPVYSKIHQEAPVCWSDAFESWLVTRYDDVVGAVEDPVFSSHSKTGPMPPTEVLEELAAGFPMTEMLYGTDPPEHTRLRALIQNAMSSDLLAAFEPRMKQLAGDVIASFAADGRADLYERYVHPLTDGAILDFVGVPAADRAQVMTWHRMWERLFIPGQEPDDLRAATREVVKYQHYHAKMVKARRAEPRDDLYTTIGRARAAGYQPLAEAEIVWGLIELIGAAGNTTYGMANVLLHVLRDEARWHRLRADRSLVPAAVEEGMRVESPVLGCARETACPVEIGGVKLPARAPVLIAFAAANHDGDVFGAAGEFDLDRDNAGRQVTLGRGPHYCIGARVARLMIAKAVEGLLDHVAAVRLDDGYEPEFYAPFPFLRSVARLPAHW